jgi:tetratricopeptide (TPR) repeat protein
LTAPWCAIMGADRVGNGMKHPRSFLALTGLVLGLALAVQPAQAQGGAKPPGSGSPGSAGGGLSPVAPSVQPPQPGYDSIPPQRPMFLSGKVMMDDGTEPPDSTMVELACSLNHLPLGYTDSKGRFSFDLSLKLAMTPDASAASPESGGSGDLFPDANLTGSSRTGATRPRLFGCEIRAVLAGYRSDVASLAGRQTRDSQDLGTLFLHRLANIDGNTISATSYEASKDAKKAYTKGLDEAKRQMWPEARAQFEKAVGLYPRYAEAWFELGQVLELENNTDQARKAYRQALEADRRFLKPYLPLTAMSIQENNWQAVAEMTAALTRLDPADYPQAFLFNAIANLQLNKLDTAEQSARKALELDPDHRFPRAAYVLGLALANKHDYEAALPLLKDFIQRAPNAPDAEAVKMQISVIETRAKAKAPQPAE